MTERDAHLKLSEIKIDNDNLDYIKMTGEICGKLRWDLVKLFAIPDVINQVCETCDPSDISSFGDNRKCNKCGKTWNEVNK